MASAPVDLIVHGANQLITVAGGGARAGARQGDLGVIRDGAVAISGDNIVAIGRTADVVRLAGPATRMLSASGRVIMPGFVDAHTHVVFVGSREAEFERRLRGDTYQQIMSAGGGILATVAATRAASLDELVNASLLRLNVMLEHGTTTAESKTGYGLNTDSELKMLRAMRVLGRRHAVELVPTFMGAHAVPADFVGRDDEYVGLIVGEMLAAAADLDDPLERPVFCDVFCEEGAFTVEQSRRVLRAGQSFGLRSKIHADEFSLGGGAGLAAELGAASADHLLCTPANDRERMAVAGVVGVLLPGTTFGLGKTRHADGRALVSAGVPVALGTDLNPGTCWCESMPMVIALACRLNGLSPAEAIVAATANAAWATGAGNKVGSLEAGKQADVLVLDLPDYRHLAYRFGTNPVSVVIKKGRVVVDRRKVCPAGSERVPADE